MTAGLGVTVGLSGGTLGLLVSAVLAGQLSVGWSNDWLDAVRDADIGRTDKPASSGAIPPDTVRLAALLSLLVAVVLSLLLGVVPCLLHLLAVALGWAYNVRLKATPASVVAYLAAFALMPVVVTTAAGEGLPAWWAVVAAGAFGAGVHLSNALPDIATDRRRGIGGLPQRLGPTASAAGSVAALALGSVAVLLGPAMADPPVEGWAWVTLLAIAVLLVAVVLAVRRSALEVAYRLTVVVGLVVVGSLVLQGAEIT